MSGVVSDPCAVTKRPFGEVGSVICAPFTLIVVPLRALAALPGVMEMGAVGLVPAPGRVTPKPEACPVVPLTVWVARMCSCPPARILPVKASFPGWEAVKYVAVLYVPSKEMSFGLAPQLVAKSVTPVLNRQV